MRKKTKILDAEGRLEVLRLNKEGHSLREIAAILDVSGTQVHRIVRQRYGLLTRGLLSGMATMISRSRLFVALFTARSVN